MARHDGADAGADDGSDSQPLHRREHLTEHDGRRQAAQERLETAEEGTAIAALLAPAARRLRALAPGVEVSVTELDTDDSPELLVQASVDIAVTTPPGDAERLPGAGYHQTTLFSEPFDLLVSVDHPLAGRTSVPLGAAAEDAWVVAAPGTWDCRHLLTAACATAGFEPRIAHEASSPLAVTALVYAGLGVSLVPRLVPLPAHHAVRRLALEGSTRPQRHVIACTPRGREADPLVERGLAVLREMADGLPPPLVPAAVEIPDNDDERTHRHAG